MKPIKQGSPFAVHLGDNLDVMRRWETGCVDMAVTSPPYCDCRTYNIGFKLTGQKWVDWMIPRVVEACRVTAGLVFVNMAGKVKDFKYGPVVEWLVADLTRQHGIVCGPAPYVFRRVGIPGSGSKHYHRRDWEPVYGFALPGNLPPRWSDNLAFGHPPKWAPGGEMSNRQTDGARVNGHGLTGEVTTHGRHKATNVRDSYGFTPHDGEPSETQRANGAKRAAFGRPGKTRKANGEFEDRPKAKGKNQWGHSLESGATVQDLAGGPVRTRGRRPSHVEASAYEQQLESARRLERGNEKGSAAVLPVLANPGNVIQEKYTAVEVAALLAEFSKGDLIDTIVGGGVMGSKLAHANEAPFPVSLPTWFIRSFCPPGGIVLDPWAGSGTSIQAAIENGRRAVAIEVRDEMVELCYARGNEAMEKIRGQSRLQGSP